MVTKRASHAAARERDSVTPGQRIELESQIQRGQVTRSAMQRFLLTHGNPLAAFPMTSNPGNLKSRIFEAFSGCGVFTDKETHDVIQPLVPIFGPFDALREYRLKPPIEDILTHSQAAIFWQPVKGVRIVTPSDLAAADKGFDLALHGRLTVAELNAIMNLQNKTMTTSAEQDGLLWGLRSAIEMLDLAGVIRGELEATVNVDPWGDNAPPEWHWQSWIKIVLVSNIEEVLAHAGAALLAGNAFVSNLWCSYLTLVLRGNLPYGTDQDNHLIIICGHQE